MENALVYLNKMQQIYVMKFLTYARCAKILVRFTSIWYFNKHLVKYVVCF